MSIEAMIGLASGGMVVIIIGITIMIKRPKKLKVDRFIASWLELQGFCRDKKTWSLAITHADRLLDEALKKRKQKGKTMGERMVSAQRIITDNDSVWFSHNLAKKIAMKANIKLKETDVKEALVGFRQALRDLGALPANNETNNDKS